MKLLYDEAQLPETLPNPKKTEAGDNFSGVNLHFSIGWVVFCSGTKHSVAHTYTCHAWGYLMLIRPHVNYARNRPELRWHLGIFLNNYPVRCIVSKHSTDCRRSLLWPQPHDPQAQQKFDSLRPQALRDGKVKKRFLSHTSISPRPASTPLGYKAHSICGTTDNSAPADGSVDEHNLLDGHRAIYVERLAQFLPEEVDLQRTPSLNARVGDRKTWKPMAAVDSRQSDMNPFSDWRTALRLLKRHSEPCSETKMEKTGTPWRWVSRYGQRDHVCQTIDPPREPQEWTTSSFVAYIHSLVMFVPPGELLHSILPAEARLENLITGSDKNRLIQSAFNNTERRNVVSVEAGNIALQYFYWARRMNDARALCLRLEYLFDELPTSTCNIVLRASAVDKDIHNFSFFLDRMVLQGFRPDHMTWCNLLMALTHVDDQLEVIGEMRLRSMMHRSDVQRDVARQMCLAEFHRSEGSDLSIGPLFKRMSDRYGRGWLSTSTGNIILSEVMRPRSGPKILAMVRALGLMNEMKQYGFVARSSTMDIFIKRFVVMKRVDLLIEVLRTFDKDWSLEPDRQAHWRLFQYAWAAEKPYFLRAVWSSACLNGFTTTWMRYLVMQSLVANELQLPPPSRRGTFRTYIGQFLVGLDSLNESAHSRGNVLAEPGFMALKSNLATIGQGRLTNKLITYLDEALAQDARWASFEDDSGQYVNGVWESAVNFDQRSIDRTSWRMKRLLLQQTKRFLRRRSQMKKMTYLPNKNKVTKYLKGLKLSHRARLPRRGSQLRFRPGSRPHPPREMSKETSEVRQIVRNLT